MFRHATKITAALALAAVLIGLAPPDASAQQSYTALYTARIRSFQPANGSPPAERDFVLSELDGAVYYFGNRGGFYFQPGYLAGSGRAYGPGFFRQINSSTYQAQIGTSVGNNIVVFLRFGNDGVPFVQVFRTIGTGRLARKSSANIELTFTNFAS